MGEGTINHGWWLGLGVWIYTTSIEINTLGIRSTSKLTTGVDSIVGTSNNDVINADHNQLSAADTINGGAGSDTLNYTDSGTVGGNVPAALVSGVEVVNIRNVNGTAGVAATKEAATVTFGAVTAGQTVIIGGQTFTDAGGGSTAAQVAAYFAANVPAGYTVTSTSGNQVVFTSNTAGVVADLAITGTGAAAQSIAIVQGAAAVASTGVADTIAAGNFVGATNFNNNLSTNDVTFTGLSATQQVGVIGNGALANGNTSFTLGGTVTATTINVANGTTAGNISNTGASVATATVNSTGAANTVGTIDLGTGTNVTALNVNAATNLTATL